MARILAYFYSDSTDELLLELEQRVRRLCAADERSAAQLMREHPEDAFFVDHVDNIGRPQLVLDITLAPGLPLSSLDNPLGSLCADLPFLPQSLALIVHERRFIPCAAQAVHYHYLMVKRADFCDADYYDYYVNFHSRMGFNTPEIAGYSQNYVDQRASEQLCTRWGMSFREVTNVSELIMPSLEALASSPALLDIAEPAFIDEERFVDRALSMSFSSEVILRIGEGAKAREAAHPQHFPAPGEGH